MALLTSFLFGYLLGGFTLLPLLASLAYFCLTSSPNKSRAAPSDTQDVPSIEEGDVAKQELAGLPSEVQVRQLDPDGASGYFAVTREYVPGGVSGKPPERSTPPGSAMTGESPSVYQTMYRSIFERNKQPGPSMDASKGNARGTKRSRNVFYVVLRYVPMLQWGYQWLNSSRLAHLMFYDDENQLEVRYVISLDQYDIDIYGGEEIIPDGELFVKRNSIRLCRRKTVDDLPVDSKPFFFFSDNCSNKEEFYHALLDTRQPPPIPLRFEHDHMVKLVRQLHASEENVQTRWFNALIGRLFLSLYKTRDFANFISTKIAKKISRVQRPAFIERIELRKIDTGDSAPLITNPKLKELTLDGDLTVEADVKYHGNFRLEISALAKIDLGQRFKPREVTLMLAAIVKSLEGHVLFRIKPPPSNRIWFSFETMPRLDLVIEPVVSARQITYGVILRAIESRIRDVIRETLVQPNWDDVPFFSTLDLTRRGGLWKDASAEYSSKDANIIQVANEEPSEGFETDEETMPDAGHSNASLYSKFNVKEKSMSMPTLIQNGDAGVQKRRTVPNIVQHRQDLDNGVSSSVEAQPAAKPKAIRSTSFATAATPIVSKDPVTAGTGNEEVKERHHGTATAVDALSGLSHVATPSDSLVNSPENQTHEQTALAMQPSSTSHGSSEYEGQDIRSSITRKRTPPTSTSNKRQSIATTAASATASAAKWGYDMIQRRKEASAAARARRIVSTSKSGIVQDTMHSALDSNLPSSPDPTGSSRFPVDAQTPIGRGQPLPPPGQPLPGPRQGRLGWTTTSFGNLTRRKPVPGRGIGKADMGPDEASSERLSVDASNAAHHGRKESQNSLSSEGDASEGPKEDPGHHGNAPGDVPKVSPPPLPPRRHEKNAVNLDNGSPADRPHSQENLLDDEPAADAASPEAVHHTLLHADGVTNGDADFGEWEENLPETPVEEETENVATTAELAPNMDEELESAQGDDLRVGDEQDRAGPQSDPIEQVLLLKESEAQQAEQSVDIGQDELIAVEQQ